MVRGHFALIFCIKEILNLKKIILGSLALLMLCGCNAKQEVQKPVDDEVVIDNAGEVEDQNTIDGKFKFKFIELSTGAENANVIAEGLAQAGFTEYDLVTMDVEPGYLNGFTEEIDGFEEATMFGPMIGTIPFVGYVFKTSDPVSLSEKLEATHDLRWNICTEADIAFSDINDKYLMFVMSPADKTEDKLEDNKITETLIVEESSGENTTVE